MAPTIATCAPMAFAPGPLLGQFPVSPSASSQVSTPSSSRLQPTKLFIGGISRRTTTKQLRDHFSQGGRVLDCVAMRTPDGRPRGFGYVTLDSPEAAQRFVTEPQMIDDRIVDMKLAVPEDHASKAATSQPMLGTMPSPMNQNAKAMHMGEFYPQQTMFYPWADDASFYYGTGYGGLPMTHMDWQQPAVQAADPTVDCVDLLTASASGLNVHAENWEPEKLVGQKAYNSKSPLSEVTNVLGNSQLLSTKKPAAVVSPNQIGSKKLQPARVSATDAFSPSATPADAPFFIFEDAPGAGSSKGSDGEDDDEASTEPGDLSPGAPSGDLSPGAPSPFDAQDLPSLGSVMHAAGDCRRCNFFAKGRCQNGHACDFCHLPHERQKLTRQEKREQRAARQAENGIESMDLEMDMPTEVPLSTAVVRGPPGLSLPEVAAEEASQPLMNMGGLLCQEQTALPSPFFRTDTMGFSGLSTRPLLSPSCLLSTSPTPLSCTTPVSSSNMVMKEMCTIGTQTDDDFTCPHCCEGCEDDNSALCNGCRD